MQIVVKHKDSVKLFRGSQPTYQKVIEFIKVSYPNIKNPQITFVDEDGDTVMVCSDEDFSALNQMFPDRKLMKLDVIELEEEKNNKAQQDQKQNIQVEEEKDNQQIQQKNIDDQQLQRQAEEYVKEKIESFQKKKKKKKDEKLTHKYNKLKKVLRKQIDQIVEEKLKIEIPLLISTIQNRLQNKIQPLKIQGVCHDGVKCNSCGLDPVCGIRYKCPECICFNLCSNCEQKIEHPHDLLKMKKPREEEQEEVEKEKRQQKIMKCAKKFIKVCKRSSSKDSSHSKDKHKKWRKRHHGYGWGCRRSREQSNIENKNQENSGVNRPWEHYYHPRHHHYPHPHPHPPPPMQMMCGLPSQVSQVVNKSQVKPDSSCIDKKSSILLQSNEKQMRINKLSKKMEKTFGKNAQTFKPFILENFNLNIHQLTKIYKSQNPDNSEFEKIAMRVRKLAIYLERDESQFVEIVKQNPGKSVKQILRIMNEQVNEQKLTRMRKRYNNESKIVDSWVETQKSQSKIVFNENKEVMVSDKTSKIQQIQAVKEQEEKKSEQEEEKKQNKEEPIRVQDFQDKQKKILQKAEEEQIKNLQLYRANSKEIRQKGRILMEMKEIFGDDRSGQIFRFIEKHFSEGLQKIIDLWLAEQCTKNYSK